MSKHRYSLTACADAIEHLVDIANSQRIKPRAGEIGELDRLKLEPAAREP